MPGSVQRSLTAFFKVPGATTKARDKAREKRERERAATVIDNAETSSAPAKDATISRPRKRVSNASRRGEKQAKAKQRPFKSKGGPKPFKHKPKSNITVFDRLKEFPNNGLVRLDSGTMECSACNYKNHRLHQKDQGRRSLQGPQAQAEVTTDENQEGGGYDEKNSTSSPTFVIVVVST